MALGQALPPKGTDYTPQDVASAIVSVHPALEMCASSFAAAAEAPHLLKMGDLQSNAAVVLGAPMPVTSSTDYAQLKIALQHDGAVVAETAEGASWEQILEALAWLANHAISRGLMLNAGDVIITGARVKHEARSPLRIEAALVGMEPVRLTLV